MTEKVRLWPVEKSDLPRLHKLIDAVHHALEAGGADGSLALATLADCLLDVLEQTPEKFLDKYIDNLVGLLLAQYGDVIIRVLVQRVAAETETRH